MIDYVRDGDKVIVHSMDRLARNLDDLRSIVTQLTSMEAEIEFIKESLIFTGKDSPMSRLMLSVKGAFTEFKRSLIKEREMEGIALAKKRGAYKGCKPSLSEEETATIRERVSNGEKKTEISRDLGISRETLYQYLKKYYIHEESAKFI